VALVLFGLQDIESGGEIREFGGELVVGGGSEELIAIDVPMA
jgi:hypothetical protein